MNPELYQQHARLEEEHWWFRGRREVIRSFLRPALPRRVGQALDVGCGTGLNARMLREFAEDIEALESSDEAIAIAREMIPELRVRKGHFPDSASGGPYQLITLLDVLEHTDDDGAALRRIEELLAPGGVALLTVPALPILWSEHDELAHHRRRYTRASMLEAITRNTSLEVQRISYFNSMLFLPIFAFRMARRALKLNPGASDFFPLPPQVNALLHGVFSAEAKLLRKVSAPVGVSLICVLRRPGSPKEA